LKFVAADDLTDDEVVAAVVASVRSLMCPRASLDKNELV
jgi:hypothetical protein